MAYVSKRFLCAYMAVISLASVVSGGLVAPSACTKSDSFKVSFPQLQSAQYQAIQNNQTGEFPSAHYFVSMRDETTCSDLNVDGKNIVVSYSVEDSRVARVANMTYVREIQEKGKEWKRGQLNMTIQYKAAGKTKLTLSITSSGTKVGEGSTELVAHPVESFNKTLDGAKLPEVGKTEQLVAPENPSCFPASSTVELESGRIIAMDALKEGDIIRSRDGKFSRVFMFSHQDAEVMAHFLRVDFSDGAQLVASHGHYIIAKDGSLVAMDSLQIGDEMLSGHHVVAISEVVERGLYNPHTLTGDLVVDGVVASSYTRAIEPRLASALLGPLRMASNVRWVKNGPALFGRYLLHGKSNAALARFANKCLSVV